MDQLKLSRKFNTTGVCIPHLHYMVDISNKLNKIKKMIIVVIILLLIDQDNMAKLLLCTCWNKH